MAIAKDLKVKGAGGGIVRVGAKVRGIRMIGYGVGEHHIDAALPGIGGSSWSRVWRRRVCRAHLGPNPPLESSHRGRWRRRKHEPQWLSSRCIRPRAHLVDGS